MGPLLVILFVFFALIGPLVWFLKSMIVILIYLVLLLILIGALGLVMKKVGDATGHDGTRR